MKDWDAFAEFWENYPKKVNKRFAMYAFNEALKEGINPQTIIDGIDTSPCCKHDWQYIPHPGNWIQGHRWDDEPDYPQSDSDNVLLIPVTREEREQQLRNQANQ